MKKFLPQNFNDALAVYLMTWFLGMWCADAMFKSFVLDDMVQGAMIPMFTAIGYFYYRKKSGESG